MKEFKQYINEAVRGAGENLIEFLNMMAKFASGFQQELFKKKAKDADSIDCVSINEVFTPEEIKHIKQYVRPKQNECYANAYHLTSCGLEHEILYCEGYIFAAGLPLEHAFNKVDGKYVDITLEMVLKKDVTSEEHVVIGEWNENDALSAMAINGVYGGVYDALFMKKYEENIEAV